MKSIKVPSNTLIFLSSNLHVYSRVRMMARIQNNDPRITDTLESEDWRQLPLTLTVFTSRNSTRPEDQAEKVITLYH